MSQLRGPDQEGPEEMAWDGSRAEIQRSVAGVLRVPRLRRKGVRRRGHAED